MRLFKHDRPHPQVLVIGFAENEFKAIAGLFPGAKRIWNLTDAHHPEWDLLVARDTDLAAAGSNLYVVAFGGQIIGRPEMPKGHDGNVVLVRDSQPNPKEGEEYLRSVATKFQSPDELPEAFAGLVAEDLVPSLEKESSHSCLFSYQPKDGDIGRPSFDIGPAQAVVQGSDSATYAAHFLREGGKAWCLSLPPDASLRWVIAAVNHWYTIDRKRFPARLDWTNKAFDWLTPEEVEALGRYVDAADEVKRAEAEKDRAWQEYTAARQIAAEGPFRLLTAQGRPLVEAVRDALAELGFAVRDMDNERAPNDLLEDLRVSPPDKASWVALAEVKGYERSPGKAVDLTNLMGRFVRRYRDEEHADPSALWYVINHEMGTDPGARRQTFPTSDGEVSSFAAADGLVIDTRDLYLLWRDVRRGRISPEDARGRLVSATGRLTYEPAPSTDTPTEGG